MMDCIFCKIIKKEIPAEIVYEDSEVFALMDINPVNPGHVLVLPKEHFETLDLVPAEKFTTLFTVVQKIMKSLLTLGNGGVNLLQNNGAVAGQVVPHVHFHVIPRNEGDGYAHWHGKAYEPGEMRLISEKVKENII